MNLKLLTHSRDHLHVRCGLRWTVKVRKVHVKAFLAYAGFSLMALDAGVALAAAHHFEPMAGPLGKVGATMAGAVPFFDKLLKAAIQGAEL